MKGWFLIENASYRRLRSSQETPAVYAGRAGFGQAADDSSACAHLKRRPTKTRRRRRGVDDTASRRFSIARAIGCASKRRCRDRSKSQTEMPPTAPGRRERLDARGLRQPKTHAADRRRERFVRGWVSPRVAGGAGDRLISDLTSSRAFCFHIDAAAPRPFSPPPRLRPTTFTHLRRRASAVAVKPLRGRSARFA